MKKIIFALLFSSTLFVGYTTLVHADSVTQQVNSTNVQEEIANIPDATFKRYINTQIFHREPGTDILISELNGITEDVSLVNPAIPGDANAISNITGIEHMTNIKNLTLANHVISNLEPLSTLTNLEKLTLSDNRISSVKALSSLVNLKSLDVSNYYENERMTYNEILDVSPLSGLQNLLEANITNQIHRRDRPMQVDEFKLSVGIRDINGHGIRSITPTNKGFYDPKTNTVIWKNVLIDQPRKMTYQWNCVGNLRNGIVIFSGEQGVVPYY